MRAAPVAAAATSRCRLATPRPSGGGSRAGPAAAAAVRGAAAGTSAAAAAAAVEDPTRKNPALYATSSAAPAAPGGGRALLVKPEVLSPAGGWPQLRAAVENGADAVYFGLTEFNARARAANFESEELPGVMAYLHDRGVKGFVVLNVLIFDEELPLLEERVRAVAAAGVDAVIVQARRGQQRAAAAAAAAALHLSGGEPSPSARCLPPICCCLH